jgi:GGDEF domain-containing protein
VTVDIRASGQRRRELRLRVARRQVSEVLVWAGALTLVFGIVNYLTLPDDAVSSWIVNLVFGPFCLVLALAVRRGVFRGEGVPWAWAVGSVVLVAMLVNTFRLDPTPANLANLVAVITAFGPLMHVWGPFIVSAAAMVAISAACFLARPAAERVDDLLVVLAALAISALLLHRRICALNALADSQAQVDHLAMFDPMTDTVNRNGLDREIAALSATAGRSEEPILVWFVDVRGLKTANDEHGHKFGDEFVVVGIGSQGEAAELNERVDVLLSADGSVPVRWSRSVTIGLASGSARGDIYRLIGEADADMYRRRLAA